MSAQLRPKRLTQRHHNRRSTRFRPVRKYVESISNLPTRASFDDLKGRPRILQAITPPARNAVNDANAHASIFQAREGWKPTTCKTVEMLFIPRSAASFVI